MLRVKHLDELPPRLREGVRSQMPQRGVVTPAAKTLRLEVLREERERLSLSMLEQLKYANLDMLFEREYRFHVERQWRLDLYSRSAALGVELHGGLSDKVRGRHVRQAGFQSDREKMNAAIECGIRVLEFWPEAIASGAALAQIERIIGRGG